MNRLLGVILRKSESLTQGTGCSATYLGERLYLAAVTGGTLPRQESKGSVSRLLKLTVTASRSAAHEQGQGTYDMANPNGRTKKGRGESRLLDH